MPPFHTVWRRRCCTKGPVWANEQMFLAIRLRSPEVSDWIHLPCGNFYTDSIVSAGFGTVPRGARPALAYLAHHTVRIRERA